MTPNPGKLLLVAGMLIAAVGAVMMFGDKIPFLNRFPFGKLPGDINIKREHFQFFAPITTSILLSLALSGLLWLINWLTKK